MLHNISHPYPKMFKAAIIASLATSAVAFNPTASRFSATKLSMTAEGLAGQTAPLGYFDPLGAQLLK